MTSKQWLLVTVLTFVTICAWVIFGVIHEQASQKIPADIQQTIKPLEPTFNTSMLESKP